MGEICAKCGRQEDSLICIDEEGTGHCRRCYEDWYARTYHFDIEISIDRAMEDRIFNPMGNDRWSYDD